jgi:hypothetical protein
LIPFFQRIFFTISLFFSLLQVSFIFNSFFPLPHFPFKWVKEAHLMKIPSMWLCQRSTSKQIHRFEKKTCDGLIPCKRNTVNYLKIDQGSRGR